MQIEGIPNTVSFLGEFIQNNIQGSSKNEKYCILPSLKDPRWIVPIFDKKLFISSLALYQPSLLSAKVFKYIAILTAKGGFPNIGKGPTIYLRKNDDVIRKLFGQNKLYYAIFTGTEGCHKKVTIQVMNKEGTILGYLKVSDNQGISKLLENEAEILSSLSKLEIKSAFFPKVLYHGQVDGMKVLAVNTLKSSKSKFSSKLSNYHIGFLEEIFQKTSGTCKFENSQFVLQLREKVNALHDHIPDSWRVRYEKVLSILDNEIGNESLAFGLCHRDFTPWNTFFNGRNLYVFDWEYAKKNYPPLIDVCHFIIQNGIFVDRLTTVGLFKKIKGYEFLINRYMESLCIDLSLFKQLLLCYLLDICTLYIEREKGTAEGHIKRPIEKWNSMIDMLLSGHSFI